LKKKRMIMGTTLFDLEVDFGIFDPKIWVFWA
jgi:hypothetical protein